MKPTDTGKLPLSLILLAIRVLVPMVRGIVSLGPLVQWWHLTAFHKKVALPMQPAGSTVAIHLKLTSWCRQTLVFTGSQIVVWNQVQFRYEIAVDTTFISYKNRSGVFIVTAVWKVCTFILTLVNYIVHFPRYNPTSASYEKGNSFSWRTEFSKTIAIEFRKG